MATAVHQPEPPSERRVEHAELSIGVSEAGAWAAAVNRLVGEAARDRGHPVSVSVHLDDGAEFRLSRLLSAPGRGFVTLVAVAEAGERLVVVPVDAIRRLEIRSESDESKAFLSRGFSLGFGA
jgi:hypothetical protein